MRPVYPRWRGEHRLFRLVLSVYRGLSPLARGTRKLRRPAPAARRFIPAGAGNTNKALTGDITLTVYPRWRGEHQLLRLFDLSSAGLSPLARGTLQERIRQRRQGRFIPAGAGNTLRDIASRGLIHGLSPLARGTQAAWRRRVF